MRQDQKNNIQHTLLQVQVFRYIQVYIGIYNFIINVQCHVIYDGSKVVSCRWMLRNGANLINPTNYSTKTEIFYFTKTEKNPPWRKFCIVIMPCAFRTQAFLNPTQIAQKEYQLLQGCSTGCSTNRYVCGISTVRRHIKNPRISHKRKLIFLLDDVLLFFFFCFPQMISEQKD